VDNLAIGALAAEFFLDRGYRSFAFYDTSQRHGQLRLEGYERRLAREGCRPIVVSSEGEGVRDRLAEAVQRLDPPVALLCSNDVMGYSACRALSERGVMIPHHTAVLGVDDDHLLCRFASPPLSSIALPNDRVGYLAAETLDRLLAGETVPAERLLPPLHVVERESTALLAVEDAAVAAAMQFIAENADEPLQVEDVAREAGLSARTLQRRFRKALGRTVWAEIHRAHVSRAQKLLTGTRMSIAEIAVASGFADFRRMAEAFRKSVGVSPAAYRRQHVDGQA
jgi:LacI family transcriptional regulator